MRQYLKKLRVSGLAAILTASTTLAGMPITTVYAATKPRVTIPGVVAQSAAPQGVTVQGKSADALIVNEKAVQNSLETIETVRKSGNREDHIKARNLIATLQPIDRLKLYVELVGDYYLKNYRTRGFRFFNAEKYLAANEDVRLDALRYSPYDIYAYALKHYLEKGILEGRSSGTDFDPMVAILVKPEIMFDIISTSDVSIPETLYSSFTQMTGKTTTDSYSILQGSLTVVSKADSSAAAPAISSSFAGSGSSSDSDEAVLNGVNNWDDDQAGITSGDTGNSKPADRPAITGDLNNGGTADTGRVDPKPQPVVVDDNGDSSGGGNTEEVNKFEEEKEPRIPSYVNNKSVNINPYVLYRDNYDNTSFSFTTYNPFDNRNNNKDVDVRFMGENYGKAKKLSQDKKYTLMLYICAADMEEDENNRKLSAELVSLMQADMTNVNVILCVGGTGSYGNSLMNADSTDGSTYGASDFRSGIYYLNPSALSDIRERLMNVNTDEGDAMYQLAGTMNGTDLSQGLHFDDIITSDSCIQLVSVSAVDMADPSFLAGYINLSTNLFPADDYGLILSGHAGGLEEGVIRTDAYEQESTSFEANELTAYELESALAATDLYRDKSVNADGKLGMILYDADLMGSTAQAYNTKDYYRYMIASEESVSGHTSYGELVTGLNADVAAGVSNSEIAIHIAEVCNKDQTSHHGSDGVHVDSVAVFSSEDMEVMCDNINELSRELSGILGADVYTGSNFKNDVFMAVRAAALSCYPTSGSDADGYYGEFRDQTKYVDIGELLTHVKYNLSKVSKDGYDKKDNKEYETLLLRLDKVLNSGFLTFLAIYNSNTGGIYKYAEYSAIPLNYTMDVKNNIWTDIRADKDGIRDYLYGSSIYMPLSGSIDDFKTSDYYKYYKDADLNDYVEFIRDYLIYFNDKSGYAKKITSLKDELADLSKSGDINKLVKQVSDTDSSSLRKVVDDNGDTRSFLSFAIADSYEEVGLTAPENSTGNPMLDILETQSTITMAAVHKQRYAASQGDKDGYLEVDMICAEAPVTPFAFALESNTISFDVMDPTRSIIDAMIMEGKAAYSDNDLDWQFVLRSDKESDETGKLEILETVFSEAEDISDADTITVSGRFVQSDDKEGEGYHVFKVTDEDGTQYSYQGSVLTVTDEEGNQSYEKADGVIAVSAYHYVLKEDPDGSGTYVKVKLEDLNGVGDEFYDTYEHKLIIKTGIPVAQQVDDKGTTDAAGTAYSIDLTGDGTYSDLGYIVESEYEADADMGSDPLPYIEIADENETEGIGVFVAKESTDDTSGTAVNDTTGQATDEAAAVAIDNCAPQEAIVGSIREDAEPEESSSDDDTDEVHDEE